MPKDTNLIADKLALGLKVAGVGLGEIDYLADTITLDARAAELFGMRQDIPLSRMALHERIHPDDWRSISNHIEAMLGGTGDRALEMEHRVVLPDGVERWFGARKEVTFRDGKLVSGLVAVRDITAAKSAEARINFLMGEVSHRSKNLMAVATTIARMTANSPEEKRFAKGFTDRLSSLAINQDALIANDWHHVPIAALIDFQLRPFVGSKADAITTSGPDLGLTPHACQAIGMALHELATNAAKYGALSAEGGRIAVEWALTDGSDAFRISWQETGGPPVKAPEQTGFGHKVIKSMAETAIDAKVDVTYAPEGLRWSLTAPAASILSPSLGLA